MQEILTKFLDTVEQTPALLQLDGALRYVFPLLALVILIRCGKSLLMFRREPEVWAWLAGPTGDRIPVMHWESLIGRGKGCDVTLEYPTISRTHAVLTRYDDGSWTIMDAGSTGGVFVNGKQQSLSVVRFGDVLSFGGVEFTLVPITQEQERIQAEARTRRAVVRPWLTLLLLTLFQMLACAQLCVHLPEDAEAILPGFLALIAVEWGLFALLRLAKRRSFDVETVAFFLTTMGLCVVSTSAPDSIRKELIAVVCGIFAYLAVSWSLRDLERAKKIRYLAAAGGILLWRRTCFSALRNSARKTGCSLEASRSSRRSWSKILLRVRGRVDLAAIDGKAEPDFVYRLFGGHLRVPGAYERLWHGDHLLCDVPDYCVPALGQLCDHRPWPARGRALQAFWRCNSSPTR